MFGAAKDCCVDREVKLGKATIEGAGGICWRLPSSPLNITYEFPQPALTSITLKDLARVITVMLICQHITAPIHSTGKIFPSSVT